jgi:hypothetical protein
VAQDKREIAGLRVTHHKSKSEQQRSKYRKERADGSAHPRCDGFRRGGHEAAQRNGAAAMLDELRRDT